MTHPDQQWDGKKLLRDGWADEDVERFTGLSLPTIVVLRAEAAAAAFDHLAEAEASLQAPHA